MKNLYRPFKVGVVKIKTLSEDTKLFRLKKNKGSFQQNKEGLIFNPGQFVLASLFGYGEAPFGTASSPCNSSYMEIIVRKVGTLTGAMHRLKKGDTLFLRGPYGNGFPIKFFENKDLILVTGGCGIPPIAALTEYIIENRDKFNRVHLIYGAWTSADLLMKNKLKEWKGKINVLLTVDKKTKDWHGHVGWVSELIDDIKVDVQNTAAAMCGPGPMMGALEKILKPMGVSDRRIFVNMERKMQCGIGKCQHCTIGNKYVCYDGPVFTFDQVDKNWD